MDGKIIFLLVTIFSITNAYLRKYRPGEPHGFFHHFHHIKHDHHDHPDFCYKGCNFVPETWSSVWPDCDGMKQSPINIDTDQANFMIVQEGLTYNHVIKKELHRDVPMKVINNGHTLEIKVQSDVQQWQLTEGSIPSEYIAYNIHLHWGQLIKKFQNGTSGSEHLIDGKGFPVEMHVVHFNKYYGHIEEAMKHKDGLLVVAKFFRIKLNKDITPLDRILLEALEYKDQLLNGTSFGKVEHINLLDLLGDLNTYYMYQGSLTTPPCTENVSWVVLKEPGYLGPNGFLSLLDLQDKHGNRLLNNNRKTQPMNGRDVIYKIVEKEPRKYRHINK